MADDVTAAGKYLLISVPEFEVDRAEGPRKGQSMTSFLRLGSYHENWEAQPGADLAKLVYDVPADVQGGHLTSPYGGEPDLGTLAGFPFLDDQRNREGAAGTVDPAERADNSQKLFERGGWWDHSDGNRVTTTYGDKVEVIRGNYKLVVMGRQEDAAAAATIDASGGVIQDCGNSMIGASVRAEYRQDVHGGVWHLENATLGFIQTDDFAGDKFSHDWGDKRYSTTGSEAGTVTKAGKEFGNPEIIERTWATKIEGYTGSAAWRIPSIHEETYATTTSSLTDVTGNISETTYCDGAVTSKTGSASRRVPTMNEESYVGASNTKTDVLASNDLTIVGAQMETTIAGALGSLTIAGAQVETEIVGVKGSVSIVPLTGEFTLGAKFGCTIGYTREVQIGSHEETSIPDKKKIALKELNTALEVMHATLNNNTVTLQEKVTALQVGIAGIQVQLGL
ncbi:MAG TPA: hypothetical protein VE093_17255 [Polyangiaceae bacterium]|jgi:hypothetical protein|nr:hypothetical protein [Polyangiaceae bacterium]